ncbi:hypothetical protein DAKH74_014010 [Maudiozyma humilis]|uniref:Reverse transcriptase domain-containing protein n=1 Tax=Maudiozyma humilis TaxID=51915 RepID=A0AAV5RTN3_MAUHU|nr:hypothetical protein DAKH74_014010 [Kazachstania humilis]
MGYKNSAQLFAAFIDHITPAHLKDKIVIYVDDLLIMGAEETITELTKEVMIRLGEYGIRFSDQKIQFKREEIEYLGYKITTTGIEPLPRHIEAIRKLPPPQTIKGLRSIIGMANFIRNWIPRVAEVLQHMMGMVKEYGKTKRTGRITMTQEVLDEFQEFKQLLQDLPSIGRFTPGKSILIFTDASKYATGAIVIQLEEDISTSEKLNTALNRIKHQQGGVKGHILGSSSHKLTKTEVNYSVYELELLAIDKVLDQYEYWLLGSPLVIISDHANIQRMQMKMRINQRIARTREFMAQFSPRLCFIEGELNTFADGLSRYPLHLSQNPHKEEVTLFEELKISPTELQITHNEDSEEHRNQALRLYNTSLSNESEGLLMHIPSMQTC